MSRRRIVHLLTAVSLALLLTWPPDVSADPTAPPAPPAPTADPGGDGVSWRQFGRPAKLELRGADAETRVDLPLGRGLRPADVSGLIGSAVNISAGKVDVLDGRGNPLGIIPIPLDAPTKPFVLNTSRAAVEDGVVTLIFVLRPDKPPTDTCAPTPAVTLSRLATTVEGRPPYPTTVADFLPPFLESVVIATGPDPSPDQQQAALTLTAMLTRTYRPIPVRVAVDTSATVPAGDTWRRRVITIQDSDESGLQIRNPGTPKAVLAISGRGSQLADQVALFIDKRLMLAQTSSATVQSATGIITPTSNLMTFGQLGIAASASVSGMTSIYAGFDGAAFAVGPIQRARVDLRARYTPTADDKASLLIKSGPFVLATLRLDQTGSLETQFDVPAQSIGSEVGLALDLQYFPSGAGGCAPLNDRLTFTVDPASTVEVTPGPAVVSGFTALPAGFTPEFAVAVDRPDLIRYAAQAINLIGQRTGTLLRPQVTALQEAAESEMPLLAVTGSQGVSGFGMTPPVSVNQSGAMAVDGSADTGASIDGPVGLVQSFTHDGRMVLSIDVPSRPELVDETFDYIRQLDSGWSSLAGDVVATGSAGDTVNLTIRSDQPGSGLPSRSDVGWKWSALATLGVSAAAVLMMLRGVLARRRRTRE